MTAFPTSKSQRSETLSVSSLQASTREAMRGLMEQHFENVQPEVFRADLDSKRSVILLWDEQGLAGFSTLGEVSLKPGVAVHYSGDTVVAPRARTRTDLPRLWVREVIGESERRPELKHFWFLICSGYRTYRFLPTFFSSFYPCHAWPTPEREKQLLDQIGEQIYGHRYQDGVVKLLQPTPLRELEIPKNRLKDPHVRFFLKRNPGFTSGDELACLTEASHQNLNRAGRWLRR